MNKLIKQIQTLYELELYSNIAQICNLIITSIEQQPDSINSIEKLQLLLMYADSLYETREFSLAEEYYRQVLQLRKKFVKNKKDNSVEMVSEIELKYKIYKCCITLKQTSAAFDILHSVTARLRTPKINMALANMYRDLGLDRNAVTCYKEVLRECPLAIEAVENLLRLGVKGVEVNSFMVELIGETNWLGLWLKGQAHLYSRDFDKALQNYKAMDSHGVLKDNPTVLINMGFCYNYLCDVDKAIFALQRAMRLNNNLTFGRDLLSTLLAAKGGNENLTSLENLATISLDMSLWSPEHWIVLGNYMLATKKFDKAIYYGQQALVQCNNVEALLLKAKTLLEINKYQDAASNCTSAIQICPYRFDIHQCLVEVYIKMNRIREAEAMALNACQQLNYNSQTLTLHASVLLKDPVSSTKAARKILEKAVASDKTLSTNAVCMLAEFFLQEQQYEQAKTLLLKYVEQVSSSRMHQLLGDSFAHLQKDEEAFHHYNVALKLDPNNQRATEGLNLSLNKKDSSYYSCNGENSYATHSQGTSAAEDQEVYAESDSDLWPTNSF